MDKKLSEIRGWVKSKIATQQEPPWAWYQYMKLIETVDAILAGRSVTTADLQQSQKCSEISHPRQAKVVALDTARRRQPDDQVQLPM